jgi:hypothetical protein
VRKRIHEVISRLYDFVSDFAMRAQDETFQARLAAGLARSFTTSARFVLDEEFAKNLFFRGRFLLEELVAEPELSEYRLPAEILID